MKRLVLVTLLTASMLCAKTHVEQTHHSHKKLWIAIGVTVATGVLAGSLAAQHRGSQPATAIPDLKRITCAICSGTAK